MRKSNSRLRLIAKSLVPPTRLTDTSGNPSESYDWKHMATVRREWQYEYWRPTMNPLDLTPGDVLDIEARVRKELYP